MLRDWLINKVFHLFTIIDTVKQVGILIKFAVTDTSVVLYDVVVIIINAADIRPYLTVYAHANLCQ
jgi:hypothetical protein